ncbi:MAG: hypothetical protein H6723_20430, partial [Sandaracinus sp.]|nr:hypothetical protein [Sandaracinus sp.]
MSLLDTLPTQSDDPLRAQAIATLREVGLPNKKTEAWRFTSVKAIVDRALPPAPVGLTAPHSDVVRFVGGHPVLPTAPRSNGVSLARVAQPSGFDVGEAFAALNTALFSDALVVTAKGVAERPLFVDHEASADTAAYARLRIVLEANAELVLVERYRGQSALSDSVVEVELGENAK